MKRQITRQNSQKLNAFSTNVAEVYNQIQVQTTQLTPLNYQEEQKKFFSSNHYNPQFTYQKEELPPVNLLLNTLWRELLSLYLPLDLESYSESLLYHFAHLHETRASIGSDHFAHNAKLLYPFRKLNPEKIAKDFPHLSFADSSGAPLMNAFEIQDYARNYIRTSEYLDSFAVVIDRSNQQTIRATIGKLIIGSAVTRNEQNVVRLIVHEIESHMLQRQNLLAGPAALFLRTQYDRELYAEGMALYNEIITNTITKSAYDLYFHRLKAVSMIDKSFREIFEYLLNYMPKNKAYVTTYRVKRGMGDTGKAGGWAKDAVYLLGYKAVCDYLSNGGRREFLYQTQVPKLGELLLKYNLLSRHTCQLPAFLEHF